MTRASICRRFLVTLAVGAAVVGAAACGGAAPKPPVPEPSEHALSGLARQHVAVLPTYAIRVMPGITWSASIPRSDALRQMTDADIAAALEDKGLAHVWILPAALAESYKRNASYADDPYALAEEPLRSPTLAPDARLPEPLASQIRTLVALHDEVRLVLAPVELRFEPAGANAGRAVLRLVLLDARMSNVRWIGEIASDTSSAFGPVITASIGAKLAGVVAAP